MFYQRLQKRWPIGLLLLIALLSIGLTTSLAKRRQTAAKTTPPNHQVVHTTNDANEPIYLEAKRLYENKQYAASIKRLQKILSSKGDSLFAQKAIFLKAQNLLASKQFEAAQAIYEKETFNLLSTERKTALAKIIIQFADKLAAKPAPHDLNAPQPNYNKAIKLYATALTLEIPDQLKGDIIYKQGLAAYAAKNYGLAIDRFHAYLEKFAPNWYGPVNSLQRIRRQAPRTAKPKGEHRFKVWYHLIESQLASKQYDAARMNAKDLLTIRHPAIHAGPSEQAKHLLVEKLGQDDQKLFGDMAWQIVRSWRLSRISADQLGQAQADLAYMQAAHRHPRLLPTRWQIAQAYQRIGQADKAIKLYQQIIASGQDWLPQGDAALTRLDDLKKSPAELLDLWQKASLYQIGNIYFNQKKYDQAIQHFETYITRYPSGASWSQCQEQIVNARYAKGFDLLKDKKYDLAKKEFVRFLTKHPLDRRHPQTLLLFGQMEMTRADE